MRTRLNTQHLHEIQSRRRCERLERARRAHHAPHCELCGVERLDSDRAAALYLRHPWLGP